MKHERGQTSFEYAVLITVVITTILSLMFYAKRAVMGRFRASAESIGPIWSGTNEKMTVINRGARLEQGFATGKSSSEIVAGTITGAGNLGKLGTNNVNQEVSARIVQDGEEKIVTNDAADRIF